MNHRPGANLARRGLFGDRVWNATAVTVVEDTPAQTVLLVVPECERQHATGVGHLRDGARRWEEMKSGEWDLVPNPWSRTRVLWFLEPGLYYSLAMFWDAASGDFISYYVNFQAPFTRSHAGFDTLDLDLDMVVSPKLEWHWKDEDDWEDALASGALEDHHIDGVTRAKPEAVGRVERDRLAHLRPWLEWQPLNGWPPARLPANWQTA